MTKWSKWRTLIIWFSVNFKSLGSHPIILLSLVSCEYKVISLTTVYDNVVSWPCRSGPIAISIYDNEFVTINGKFVSIKTLCTNQTKSISFTLFYWECAQSSFYIFDVIVSSSAIDNARIIWNWTNFAFIIASCWTVANTISVWRNFTNFHSRIESKSSMQLRE